MPSDYELVRKLTDALRLADNQLHDNRTGRTERLARVAAEVVREHVEGLSAENERLRVAIQRALDDEESGDGWGPDNTVCAYLRCALDPTPERVRLLAEFDEANRRTGSA